MSTYILSDLHGCNNTFRKALKHIKLKKTDTLVLLGDLIDRGNDSKGVLDTVILLIENGFNIICLKGNHEQMFLDAFGSIQSKVNWFKNGGESTLSSFYTTSIEKIPSKYIDLIKSFSMFHIYENFIFVHAGLNMTLENPFVDYHTMLWIRNPEEYLNKEWLDERIVIHGHNPTSKSEIENQLVNNKKIICIDNGCFIERDGYGHICVLDLENLNFHFIESDYEDIRNN